jgi:hypothetical protein
MRRPAWVARAIAVFVISFSVISVAEEIQLKDGTKITGKLTAINDDAFRIKTAYGEISVPRSDILNITFPENQSQKGDAQKAISAEPVDESLEGSRYTNRTAGFDVTVPSGWALAPELRKSKEIVAALKSPDQTLFFMVTPEQFPGTLATYRVLAETQFQSSFNNYEKLDQSEVELDKRSGLRITFHGKTKDTDTWVRFMVYILPYEGRMVRLSFLTLEPLFSDAIPTFEKIAASYHTINPAGKSSR